MNVKRKRVPGGGSSYSKTMRAKAHGTVNNYSFVIADILTRVSSKLIVVQ